MDMFWQDFQVEFAVCVHQWETDRSIYVPVKNCLQALVTHVLESDLRSTVPEDVLLSILKVLQQKEPYELVLESVRVVRNLSGENWIQLPQIWTQLLQECTHLIKDILFKGDAKQNVLIAQIGLQFMNNVLNNQPTLANLIWENFSHEFSKMLSHENDKICLYSSSVLYSILQKSPSICKEVVQSKEDSNLASVVIISSHSGILFSQFSVQLFMQEAGILELLFQTQDLDTRLKLLHQVAEFVPDTQMHVSNWRFLSRIFSERSNLILETCESPSLNLEAVEVASMIEILAKGSSIETCKNELLLDASLLETTVDLLKSIHCLGKAGSNYFSVVPDHFDSVEEHPALNFKCNLVRLLGNLCYQNTVAQDRIRFLEAIGTLLECCNLDARNPFIQQWSVLAIRNLCEKNRANQKIISSLTRQGVVQPQVLANLGLVVEESSSGLSVRPSKNEKLP